MLDTLLQLYGLSSTIDWSHVCTAASHRPALETRLKSVPVDVLLNTSDDKLLVEFFADMPTQLAVADRIQQLGVPLSMEPVVKKRPRPTLPEPPAKRLQIVKNLVMWTGNTRIPTPADYQAAEPATEVAERPVRKRQQTTFLANEQEPVPEDNNKEEEEEEVDQPIRKRRRASKPKANGAGFIEAWTDEVDLPVLTYFDLAKNPVLLEHLRKRTPGKPPAPPMLHCLKLWNVSTSQVFKPWLDMQICIMVRVKSMRDANPAQDAYYPCAAESTDTFDEWCRTADVQIREYCNFLPAPPGRRTLRQLLLRFRWLRVLGTDPKHRAVLELGVRWGVVTHRLECTWQSAIDAYMLMMALYPADLMDHTARNYLRASSSRWNEPAFRLEVAETSFRQWWYYQAFFGCSVARRIAETQKPRSIELPTGRTFVHQT
jgi:hypothetical protein